jgi:histidyl-tRNA synthetase
MTDFVCEDCRRHFETLQQNLEQFQIAYQVNPKMVRGLDYYTRTTFEVTTSISAPRMRCWGEAVTTTSCGTWEGRTFPGSGLSIGLERLASLIPEPDAKSSRGRSFSSPPSDDKASRRPFSCATGSG